MCDVELGPSVLWASPHVSMEECTSGICFGGCAVGVFLPSKLIVQLHAKVFDAVCSVHDMTMDGAVLLNYITLVGETFLNETPLAIFPPSSVWC